MQRAPRSARRAGGRGILSFFRLPLIDGQEPPRVLFVEGKALFAGLMLVRHGNADKEEEQRVEDRARERPPIGGEHAHRGEGDPPPEEDLAEVIGMTGILPYALSEKALSAVVLELMHRAVRREFEERGEDAEREKYAEPCAERRCLFEEENDGQHAGIDHKGGEQVDPEEIYQKIELARAFFEHRIAPILKIVFQPPKGISPIRREADAPKIDRHHRKDDGRGKDLLHDGKPRHDHHGLNAPIGVVDRSVAEHHAESVYDDGRGDVGDEQRKRERQRKKVHQQSADGDRCQIDEQNDDIAQRLLLLDLHSVLDLFFLSFIIKFPVRSVKKKFTKNRAFCVRFGNRSGERGNRRQSITFRRRFFLS